MRESSCQSTSPDEYYLRTLIVRLFGLHTATNQYINVLSLSRQISINKVRAKIIYNKTHDAIKSFESAFFRLVFILFLSIYVRFL